MARVTVRAIFSVQVFYSPKTAANTNATEEKLEHVQITTVHGFRLYL